MAGESSSCKTVLEFSMCCVHLMWDRKNNRSKKKSLIYLVTSSCAFWCFSLLRGQNETVTLTSHFDVIPPQNDFSSWHFHSLFFSHSHTKREATLRFRALCRFYSNVVFFPQFSPWLQIRQFCQETLSINWTSLPCIQGINFITWMRGHSLFLLSLWIDANEMEVTPALWQWFQHFTDLFFFSFKKKKNKKCLQCLNLLWFLTAASAESNDWKSHSLHSIISETLNTTTYHLSQVTALSTGYTV